MSPRSIARWLAELESDSWIASHDGFNKASFDKTKHYTINFGKYDCAVLGEKQPKKQQLEWEKSIKSTISQNGESISQNGLSISQNGQTIPSLNISISSKEDIVVFEENDPAPKNAIPSDEVIAHLNLRLGLDGKKGFRANSKATVSLIRARWAEGFKLDDFKAVIDDRVERWGGDANMAEYLRPSTLFGTKFEGYLQAAIAGPKHANNDAALNDAVLSPEMEQRYQSYIKYVIEKFPNLFRSACRIFSKSEYEDYFQDKSLPGVKYLYTAREKRDIQLRLHARLDSDKNFRSKFPAAFDAWRAQAKASANNQTPLV
jgi:uncharacterized phage protein (TIGR02220 family)